VKDTLQWVPGFTPFMQRFSAITKAGLSTLTETLRGMRPVFLNDIFSDGLVLGGTASNLRLVGLTCWAINNEAASSTMSNIESLMNKPLFSGLAACGPASFKLRDADLKYAKLFGLASERGNQGSISIDMRNIGHGN